MAEAEDRGLKQLALGGMSCHVSINGSAKVGGVKKYKRKIALTIGLLDSKVCAYEGQRKVLADHGIDVADVIKPHWTCFTPTRAKAASSVPTSRPSTPTFRQWASVRTTAGRLESSVPLGARSG